METSPKDQFVIAKETFSEYSSNKARYYSVTDGYTDYFEGGNGLTPLTEAKECAKKYGFKTLKVTGMGWYDKDKIYNLKK